MTHASSRVEESARTRADLDSGRIRFRRAITLVLMTLVLPGSAQLVSGSKRVGRIAIRVVLGLVALVLVTAVVGYLNPGIALTIGTDPTALTAVRLGLLVLAVAWIGLFVDAWRLGMPLELRRSHRLMMVGVSSTLCFVTAGALVASAHVVSVQQDFIAHVFGSTAVSAPDGGRYNVLLLGGDSGIDRSGLRPDTLMVASIDQETGRTVLIGLPRNLANVPFPEDSPMHDEFPDGFDCDGCYINGVNTWVADNPELFEGQKRPGIRATMDAVEASTGLKMNYYAMINMRGFEDLVDAVGGVTINVRTPVPIDGVGAPVSGEIPAGVQKLDGYHALWYARSRTADDDYSRMARQKCVMNAMLQQLSPQQVLLNVEDIADSSKRLLSTDIPGKELDRFIGLALKARTQKVSTVSIVPPAINTSDPDYDEVRSMVERAIDKAEGTSVPSVDGTKKRGRKSNNAGGSSSSKKANDTEDLSKVC